jgi:Polyketide cyclase / dehydrase and lipid transport
MGHTEYEVHVERSPAAVWAYLTDWRHDRDWQEGWLEVTVDPAGPLRPGTRKTKVRRTPIGTQGLTVEATRVDDIEREWTDVVVKGLAAGTTGHCRILPEGAGSRVRISMDTPRHGLARWLAPIIERSSGPVIGGGMARLRDILEGDASDAGRLEQPGEGSTA